MNFRFVTLAVDNAFLASISALRDVLQIANGIIARHQFSTKRALPLLESYLVSADGKPITTFCGLQLPVDCSIKDAPQPSVIYVPGIYTAPAAHRDHRRWVEQPDYIAAATSSFDLYLQDNAELLELVLPWLCKQHQQGAAIAGLATGNMLLAEAGLLQRMRVPVPWVMEACMRRRYPGLTPEGHRDIVVEGDIYCAGNMGSGIALAIELVRRFAPIAIVDLVARQVRPLEVALETPTVTAIADGSDPVVMRAMALIQQRFAQTIDFETLASNLAVSQRTLIRHFNHDLGMPPHAYQQQLRLEAAQRLLATTQLPVGQIAAQVGYLDAAYFSRLFRQRLGISAQSYQAQCRRTRVSACQHRAS